MSSIAGSSTLVSSSTFIEDAELYTNNEEEYISLLTFCQHSLNNVDSDNNDDNNDNNEDKNINTESVHKGKCKLTKVIQQKLSPPSSNFEYFIHSKSLHQVSVRLPSDLNVDTIVVNTNLYALTKDAGAIGLFKLPSLDQYWNEDTRLPVHHISKQMSLKRFEQIKRFLHVSSSAITIKNYFDKLELLLSHIQNVSKHFYTPNSNVSVDEIIIQFSGRSIHTVQIKNKPTPEGFKILSLCDAGYTYTFLPTSCISPNDVKKINGLSQTGCLVLHLVEQLPYHRFSYNIYMDNYFSSVPLYQHLWQIGIGACGTVRKNASGFPKELKVDKSIKLDWDIRSGVIINEVLAVFWQDNGPVTILSMIHGLVGEE
ncbi:9306_t:CDS:2 [Ambispora gerdemannii]|uniref:9306_t:CDS:1 n=1 Tax=Ambispora gerdemannii TaxID=144530 RepID=A0A9N9CXJ2_9GLOM|nr:9306_t:CDS:2 [Ambispora gerdemannii]